MAGPQPKPKIVTRKRMAGEASDGNRKYGSNGGDTDFTVAELKQYIVDPLDECITMQDFLELVTWAASESEQLLKALYFACRADELTDFVDYLEVTYGCRCNQ